jgi:hypothetical protein
MTNIPLTVLVHDGPAARMYLEVMYRAGYHAENIVLMVYSPLPGTHAAFGTWIPFRNARRWYQKTIQEHRMMFWPRKIIAERPAACRLLFDELQCIHPEAGSIIRAITEPAQWKRYTDTVETVSLSNFKATDLSSTLNRKACKYVLFTGGGLVPAELLEGRHYKILHVHPGILPDIRGADGMLWSMLVRKKSGASCFIMAPALDEGDILLQREFDMPRFSVPHDVAADTKILYRILFSFIDPLIRAVTFADLLKNSAGLSRMPALQHQNSPAGETYHFMHPDLQRLAMARIFNIEKQ